MPLQKLGAVCDFLADQGPGLSHYSAGWYCAFVLHPFLRFTT